MVVETLTRAPQRSTAEPLSPELVLVSPELRAEVLRRLGSVERASLDRTAIFYDVPTRAPEPSVAPSWSVLVERVEVSAEVPMVILLALWGAASILRVMVVIGVPIVLAVAVITLLGS